jgi:acetolactate synthase I/II/III large subunit
MHRSTGASILTQLLKRAGVERVFTLSGNQILPIYDAFIDHDIATTDTRHESAAAHMADAWATLRGVPGVCLVTAGPGHTNALSGITTAAHGESPVLWLSGGSALAHRGMGAFQEIDQIGIARAVCKGAWQVESVADLPDLFARAWRVMQEGRPGPAHLTLPADLLEQESTEGLAAVEQVSLEPALQPTDPALVDRTLSLLAGAERPLLIASPSVARGRAGERLRAINDQSGIPYFVMESARGLSDAGTNTLSSRFRDADVVLLIGPRDFEVQFGGPEAFDPAARLIQVSPIRAELEREPAPEIGLEGDAASVLGQLLDGCREYRWDNDAWRGFLDEARAAARDGLAEFRHARDVPMHPLRLAAELRGAMPEDAILVQDGGEFSQWVRWEFADTDHLTLPNGKLGIIGNGIPYAIAAALARPDTPVVTIMGDGTFGFHGMEFDTAVRHDVPFVAIIGNDAAWAAERHRQVRIYGEDRIVASDLLPARYDKVVEALGGYGELVEDPNDVHAAFGRALASGKPACLNVMIHSMPSPARL